MVSVHLITSWSLMAIPREDTKQEVADWMVQGGGPVATALVSLSRLGIEAAFMGLVSDDEAGGEIRRGLVQGWASMSPTLVERRGGRSQTAFITINRVEGTRTDPLAETYGEIDRTVRGRKETFSMGPPFSSWTVSLALALY